MPRSPRRLPLALCAVWLTVACTHTVTGSGMRVAPGIDDDSLSPVDVDTVLLEQPRMQAITGGGDDLTVVPTMDGKSPVDITFFADGVPPQCRWYFAETATFGPDVEEFHKTTYQDPPAAALISQGAAGYRDPAVARRVLDGLVGQVGACASTAAGSEFVGDWTATPGALQTRTGRCGRDYRLKSVVLVEVTFCGYPTSVPDIVMTNILSRIPG